MKISQLHLKRSIESELNEQLMSATPEDTLRWAVNEFGKRVSLASSFGAEDVVLIDMLRKITSCPRIFLLDTGRLHQETYEVVDRIRTKYGVQIETYFPQTEAVQQLVYLKGPNSFYNSIDDRKECCRIRKVEPLMRALSNVDAWITGLRRSQAVTRAELSKIQIDYTHGEILKINPLVDWSDDQLWDYIKANDVPYNRLHDKGFPSIGCVPCTRATEPGEDIRAGRWWWESPEHKECGLHTK